MNVLFMNLEITQCTTDCSNVAQGGMFPFCGSCTEFVTCFPGFMVRLACGAGLIFDINVMGCAPAQGGVCGTTEISPARTEVTECSNNCAGITAPGLYPVCGNCAAYDVCINSALLGSVTCSAELLFDIVTQTCNFPESTTCGIARPTSAVTSPATSQTTAVVLTPNRTEVAPCSRDCSTQAAPGLYPVCGDCSKYHICSSGILIGEVQCTGGLLFDIVGTTCNFPEVTTCGVEDATSSGSTVLRALGGLGECVDDCSRKANGDYQSCNGCNMYASCSNGIMIDERPCAKAGTVWDDRLKQCMYTSSTCTDA
ncbi:hypothetical protein LOTGIDRAFT_163871 [Lottia gigantea]|uniref:Chitin-binding type-2 domain-containing protein n=1 Tax=Lottia gigantea TaxID=225164 RepID=V4A6J8_LOTGI|nr:hypothetical protein LOTGIDRAFT_163871 [Lottia gigantea]ESO90650.1 hypothetical protein LOTGIDRAFT_163871 [Lottia gigantea]